MKAMLESIALAKRFPTRPWPVPQQQEWRAAPTEGVET